MPDRDEQMKLFCEAMLKEGIAANVDPDGNILIELDSYKGPVIGKASVAGSGKAWKMDFMLGDVTCRKAKNSLRWYVDHLNRSNRDCYLKIRRRTIDIEVILLKSEVRKGGFGKAFDRLLNFINSESPLLEKLGNGTVPETVMELQKKEIELIMSEW